MALESSPAWVGVVARRRGTVRRGDRVFTGLALGSGIVVLAILVAIAVFLVAKAVPGFRADTINPLTSTAWNPDATKPQWGIAAVAFGTVLSSLMALVIAVPVALGVALFITEYAPRRVSRLLAYAVDLLAAVPSVVYGLWGVYWLAPRMTGVQGWLSTYAGWFPLFGQASSTSGRTIFVSSLVLAIMILPIISAISREVLAQVDPAQKEGALALGATRWEVIRTAVLPPSRSGIVGATMLGLGRALGETIAIALVLGTSFALQWHVLVPGGNTIAANIAITWGEAGGTGRAALIASGLVLFLVTLAVNMAARAVVSRRAG